MVTSSVLALFTLLALETAAAQLPPSIRAARPDAALADADRTRVCRELTGLVKSLKDDAAWLRSPHGQREVRDLDRMLASLDCTEGEGPLAGTWRITGKPQFPHIAPMNGTVTLRVVDQATGRRLAAEPNWGVAASRTCESGLFFYAGTIVWDKDSFFDRSRLYWTDGPSTIVLCAATADAVFAKGNFRDSRQAHGGFIQWNGSGEGFIVPESVEGPEQNFTPRRGQ